MKNADASNVRVYGISRNQPEIRRQAWMLPVTIFMSDSPASASNARAYAVVLPSTTTLVRLLQP